MNKKSILTTAVTCAILTGCGLFPKEVERVEALKEQNKIEEQNQEEKIEEQNQKYSETARPLEEVIEENDLDKMVELESIDGEEKDTYDNPEDLSKYVSQKLYDFYTLQLSPEQYYQFLVQYGSQNVVNSLPSKKDAISIFTSLQSNYRELNITGDGFTITNITLNRMNQEGFFYRKVNSTNGEEFFITTVVKEGNEWKYDNDSPSPPYRIEKNEDDR